MKQRLLGLCICGSLLALAALHLVVGALHPISGYSDGLIQLCLLAMGAAVVRLWLHLLVACRQAWLGLPMTGRSLWARSVVVAVCGGASVMLALPASADTEQPDNAVMILDGLPLPEVPTKTQRPVHAIPPTPPAPTAPTAPPALTTPREPATPPATHRPAPLTEFYVVQPGDSLWALARRASPQATDAQILRTVAEWYALNRDVIGPDPSLIHPGQRLTLSEGAH